MSSPLPFQSGLLVLAVAAVIGCFFVRRRKWAPALWLPLACLAAWQSLRVLQVMAAHSGQGMEALGSLFALLGGWPWFAVLLMALMAFPRRWTRLAAGIGIVGTIVGAVVLPQTTTVRLPVRVIGADGEPVGDFSIWTSGRDRDWGDLARRRVVSGSDGEITLRYDPNGSLSLESDRGGQFATVRAQLRDPRREQGRMPGGLVAVDLWWRTGELSQGTAFVQPLAGDEPLPFFLKRGDQLVSSAFLAHLRAQLHRARLTGGMESESIGGACRNAESFELIEELGAILAERPELRRSVIRAWGDVAEVLRDLDEFNRRIDNRGEIRGLDRDQAALYLALCAWAQVAPAESGAGTAGAISGKLTGYANRLIAASSPYWGDHEDTAAGVVGQLGRLGKPALADFAAVYPSAVPRARQHVLRAIGDMKPAVSDVEWMVASDDPELVAYGYEAARNQIRPEECALAVERLLRFRKRGVNDQVQMRINYLVPAFGGPE